MKFIKTAGFKEAQGNTSSKPVSLPAKIKRDINNRISSLTNGQYFEQIPLQDLFDILKSHNINAIQEDGMNWEGMLMGGKECGDPEGSNQNVNFELVVENEGQRSLIRNSMLTLAWCVMPSGKYEITSYLG